LSKRQFVLRGFTTEDATFAIFVMELGASEAGRFMQACVVRDCQDHRHKRLRTRSAITSCGLWMKPAGLCTARRARRRSWSRVGGQVLQCTITRLHQTCRCQTFNYLILSMDSVIEMVANYW